MADACYPAGQIAQLMLLRGDAQLNLAVSIDPLTDTLTSPAHGFTTGSRIRVASTGTTPGGSAAGVDYYAIVLNSDSYKLALTLADAQASNPINLTDSGTGAITINEQLLSAADPIAVLIAKELASGGAYARQAISVGAAVIVGTEAAKPDVVITVTNTGATDLVYRHTMIAFGAIGAIGDTTGITGFDLKTSGVDEVTAPGQTREFRISLGAQQGI